MALAWQAQEIEPLNRQYLNVRLLKKGLGVPGFRLCYKARLAGRDHTSGGPVLRPFLQARYSQTLCLPDQ